MKRFLRNAMLTSLLMALFTLTSLFVPLTAHAQATSPSAHQQKTTQTVSDHPAQAQMAACSAFIVPYYAGSSGRTVTFSVQWGCAGGAVWHPIFIDFGDSSSASWTCGLNCDSGSHTFTHTYPFSQEYLVTATINSELEPFFDYQIASGTNYIFS